MIICSINNSILVSFNNAFAWIAMYFTRMKLIYLNWNNSNGLSLNINVCKFDNRLVCGGNVSSLLCDKSKNSKSVKCMNNEFGILSILIGEKRNKQIFTRNFIQIVEKKKWFFFSNRNNFRRNKCVRFKNSIKFVLNEEKFLKIHKTVWI